jgi:multidrug efflux pump subunit AcrA (membrane-fusion protein)
MSSLNTTATFTRTARFPRPTASAGNSFVRKTAWLVAAFLGIAAITALLSAWRSVHAESAAPAHGGAEEHSIPQVVTATPKRSATSDVVLPATVRPWQATTLHSRVTGYLLAWHADLGAEVKAGQLLAELETPELDQEVSESEAQAQEALAAAAQARAEYAEAEAALQASIAQLARVQSELELARSQLVRREKLIATNSISQEERDTFQKMWEARTADVAAAHAEVNHRRTNLQTRQAVIAAREATAQSRSANVERLKQLQAFKRIVAPFDGTVTRRNAEVGMLITAGAEPLFEVQDMTRVRVQLNVPQTTAPQVHPGASATITIPESAIEPVTGEVSRIASSIDATTRTMLAEIELDNSEIRLQPGSYAQVRLGISNDNAPWTVPFSTVRMNSSGPQVLVVDSAGRIEVRPVKLGRDLGTSIVVLEGIVGNERLVVNPTDSLAAGQQVHVQAAGKVAQR